MRHNAQTRRLGRKGAHLRAVIKNMVASLIKHGRVETTLVKAKVVRSYAEKMVTLGKRGDLHARRQAFAFLRDDDAVKTMFDQIAPRFKERTGGYTRILKLGARVGDAAPASILEWTDYQLPPKKEA